MAVSPLREEVLEEPEGKLARSQEHSIRLWV
jgi:hypothetical protein